MRYRLPEEAIKKAIFHNYLHLVLPKISLGMTLIALEVAPRPIQNCPQGEHTPGLQEFGMPLPPKANLRCALSGQVLTALLLEQCQGYCHICTTVFRQDVRGRNSRLSGVTGCQFHQLQLQCVLRSESFC